MTAQHDSFETDMTRFDATHDRLEIIATAPAACLAVLLINSPVTVLPDPHLIHSLVHIPSSLALPIRPVGSLEGYREFEVWANRRHAGAVVRPRRGVAGNLRGVG